MKGIWPTKRNCDRMPRSARKSSNGIISGWMDGKEEGRKEYDKGGLASSSKEGSGCPKLGNSRKMSINQVHGPAIPHWNVFDAKARGAVVFVYAKYLSKRSTSLICDRMQMIRMRSQWDPKRSADNPKRVHPHNAPTAFAPSITDFPVTKTAEMALRLTPACFPPYCSFSNCRRTNGDG
jgi:hypothetical protein